LRDEVTDWCIQYGSWLSATRLSNLLSAASEHTRANFGELAATIAAHSSLRWRGETTPRNFKPTNRSRLESFQAPSLVGLRLRAILGVGARAEVMRVFLARPNLSCSASDLVDDTGFKKRNVADALESLRLGGALEAERTRNQIRYRLHDATACRALFGEMPEMRPQWTSILPLLATLADAHGRMATLPLRVRNVEVAKLIRDNSQILQKAELSQPKAEWASFEEWVTNIAVSVAKGNGDSYVGHPTHKSKHLTKRKGCSDASKAVA
jgi:hypothetical protein